MMKKYVSLVLALCLVCLSVSVLAEAAAIPQTYDELPPSVVAENVAEFYGTWQAQYAAYNGEVLSLEEAAPNFGGTIPFFVIDEETVSASVGEGEEAATESYAYDFDAEYGQITVVNPETGEIGAVIDLLEDGSIEVMYILDESSLSLFMTLVPEKTDSGGFRCGAGTFLLFRKQAGVQARLDSGPEIRYNPRILISEEKELTWTGLIMM